jgi:methionyl-tRNA synthetase
MVRQYFKGTLPEPGEENEADRAVREDFAKLKSTVRGLLEGYAINRALEEIWVYIGAVNKYLASNEPWKLAKDPALRPRLARVLHQAAAAIRGLAFLLFPALPGSAAKIWRFLGETGSPAEVSYDDFAFQGFEPSRTIQEPVALFPRVDLKEFLAEETKPEPAPPAPAPELKTEGKTMDILTYEEFSKLDLRVAHVIKAERVEGAKKLLKLQIDIGTEQRQIVAGVAETYAPEDLAGKKFIVIANLKPAVIRGVESQGMLLAAVVDDKASIPFFDPAVPAGAKVK